MGTTEERLPYRGVIEDISLFCNAVRLALPGFRAAEPIWVGCGAIRTRTAASEVPACLARSSRQGV
jgi:hypothetical protein